MSTPSIEQTSALVKVEQLTPMQMFAPGTLDPIVERIKAEVRAIETDISTEAGRKAIGSLCYKISRTKTFIDMQRLELVSAEKKRLAGIDAEGRRVWDELDALRDEVRKPLTDWENSEKARIEEHEARIAKMTAILNAFDIDTLADVERYGQSVDELWNHNFQEFTKKATQQYELVQMHLAGEKKRILDAIAFRAELDRLRIEREEKARIDREAKVAEDARLKAEAEAKRREDAAAESARQREAELLRTAADEKARNASAAARLEREKEAAEARARKAEDDRIAAEKKASDDRIAADKKAADDLAAAAEETRKWQEQVRDAEQRVAAITAAQRNLDSAKDELIQAADRATDLGHRKEIHKKLVRALITHGIPQTKAIALIRAISEGAIPELSITY